MKSLHNLGGKERESEREMEVTLEGKGPGYAGETPHGLGDTRVLLLVIQNWDH